jgi:hypothetical protein
MMVWQGSGFLAALVGIALMVLTDLTVRARTHDPDYYHAHGWPKLVACWIAAAVIYALARYLDSRPATMVIGRGTGREIEMKRVHSLFFLPLKYWPYLYLIFGVIGFFTSKS